MDVRLIQESELDGFITVLEHAFGIEVKEERRHEFAEEFELDRLFGGFDGDQVVGSGGAYTFDLTVPGGAVRCGGTTVIAVLPTHRRRGLLTRMMGFHLDEVESRGEPVAALWASEPPIYGRFGYGVASFLYRLKMERNRVTFPRQPLGSGSVRLVEKDEAGEVLPVLYERLRVLRPGFVTRPASRWKYSFLNDPPERRNGGTPQRIAVYEEGGEALGYVMYRQNEKWDGGNAANRITASAMHAITPGAEDGLWRYLAGIDLVGTIESWNSDPNSLLPLLVGDSRRVERTLSDGLWVRILDVPGALVGRRYAAEGRLVLEIVDPFRGSGSGTFLLEGGPDEARCEPADDPPDLRMDVRQLGSLYLGGVTATELSRAGLIEGTEAAVRRADGMFGWHLKPWCPEVF